MTDDASPIRNSEPAPSSRDDTDVTSRWLFRTSVAIVVSLGLFTALVFLLLRSETDDAAVIGAARLTWDPTTDDPLGEGKAASVEIIDDDGRLSVYIYDIEVLRPPADFEFIEAWLVDSSGDDDTRLSVGTFDAIRTRLFTLPDDTEALDFDRVEFSLEPDDGDDAYSGRTLMQGEIAWLTEPPG